MSELTGNSYPDISTFVIVIIVSIVIAALWLSYKKSTMSLYMGDHVYQVGHTNSRQYACMRDSYGELRGHKGYLLEDVSKQDNVYVHYYQVGRLSMKNHYASVGALKLLDRPGVWVRGDGFFNKLWLIYVKNQMAEGVSAKLKELIVNKGLTNDCPCCCQGGNIHTMHCDWVALANRILHKKKYVVGERTAEQGLGWASNVKIYLAKESTQ